MNYHDVILRRLLTVSRGKVVEIDVIIDPERLRRVDLAVLDG